MLRRFSEGDPPVLFELLADKEVNTFLPWFPAESLDDARRFYEERYARVYGKPRGYAYAICLGEGGGLAGCIKVDANEPYDFGYALRRECWGKGIVAEAGSALIERLKHDGMPYVTATHDVDNPRSGKVMKRLGMRYCYSYEERWQPKDFLVTFRLYQLNLADPEAPTYEGYRQRRGAR